MRKFSILHKVFLITLIGIFALGVGSAFCDFGDLATLGDSVWRVISTGNLIPGSNNAYDIGATGTRVKAIYSVTSDSSGATTHTGAATFGRTILVTSAQTAGIATLSSGSVTVNSTSVTASSEILLTRKVVSGTPGHLDISASNAGANFTIHSSSAENSTVSWLVVN
jgi:hypothetical protein